jgi:hypothetical protein
MMTMPSDQRALLRVACLLLSFLSALTCAYDAHAAGLELGKLHQLAPTEATVQAVFKGFDRNAKESVYELVLVNTSGAPLEGPLYITIEGLATPNVTVKNPSGTTTSGLPYFILTTAGVKPGAQVTLPIAFANPQNVRFTFSVSGYSTPGTQVPPLAVEITSPPTLITVGATPLAVDGTINDASATLTLNGVPVGHSGGQFHANVALGEGHNAIVARATNSRGDEATATISVSLDMTPPYITVESPLDGAVVNDGVINVSGLVNDIVRGTVSDGQAQVTVNGRAATVANRSYLATNVPLAEGPNAIEVRASDQVGNTATLVIHVTYVVPAGAHLEIVSGQGQEAQIRQSLLQPLAVKLIAANGQPAIGKTVVFRVDQDDGVVSAAGEEGIAVLAITNTSGVASARYRLGARAGVGNQRVIAKAIGFEGETTFVASALPKPGNKVSVNSGNNQRGSPHQPLPLPFVVVVTDDGANVIEGAQIAFTVTSGGGVFQNGQPAIVATTDSDGRASAKLTLGDSLGLDVHRVTATLLGRQLAAGFTASALQSGPPGQTSISGVVLDNQDRPLPNVTLRVDGTTREAKTDAQGRFKVTEAPVGPVHLIADGSTTTTPGEWPTLPYNLVTIAGADNPLASPVYLVKLDTAHAVTVGAIDRDVTIPEVPGFKLSVKAGSVTFPNGDRVGQLSVTPVNVAKIPMAPPNGMQPQFIVTIQPSGARFDPPAPLQLPNVDGHPPGAQVEMYSFDHDLEEFVSIGLGTVSSDGTTIASNPGIGVIKAGWHCGSQPGGSGCTEECGPCSTPNDECVCIPIPAPQLAARGLASQCTDQCPIDEDTPHDCQKPSCNGSNPVSIPDPNDRPVDTSPGDCKSLQCFASTPSNDDADVPADKCKACKAGASIDAQIKDLAIEANGQRGEFVGVVTDDTPQGIAVRFTAPLIADRCEHLVYEWDIGGHKETTPTVDLMLGAGPQGTEINATVTVSCADCATMASASATIPVKIGVFTHFAVEIPGTTTRRTDIGVGETVTFFVHPTTPATELTLESGGGTLEPNTPGAETYVYTAPDTSTTATIRLASTQFGQRLVTLHVFEPNAISFQKTDQFPVLGSNRAGAIMGLSAKVHSIDPTGNERLVSFGNLEIRNDSVPSTDMQGFFAQKQPILSGTMLGGFSNVQNDNKLINSVIVGIDGEIVEEPPPWARGTLRFEIPWRYKVRDTNLSLHEFTTEERFVTMDGPQDFLGAGTIHIGENVLPGPPPLPCIIRVVDDPETLVRPCF